jgi:DNA-binding YbaB/EbfC family protein
MSFLWYAQSMDTPWCMGDNAMKDLMGMMKQAQQLQERMQKMQDELAAMEIEGQSGAGLVKVTLNGKGDMRRLKIDPTLMKVDEREILEDLIVAASQDAKTKVEAAMQAKMQEMAGGLPLPPGLKLF